MGKKILRFVGVSVLGLFAMLVVLPLAAVVLALIGILEETVENASVIRKIALGQPYVLTRTMRVPIGTVGQVLWFLEHREQVFEKFPEAQVLAKHDPASVQEARRKFWPKSLKK